MHNNAIKKTREGQTFSIFTQKLVFSPSFREILGTLTKVGYLSDTIVGYG